VIFSRKRDSGGRHAARRRERDEFGPQPAEDDETPGGREFGPYDVDDAPEADRLDLGSLLIPVPAGVELRVQADPDGQIQQVMLVSGDSALQLGVFAAPRSEGIWDEVRDDIRKQLFNDGVAAEESEGEYGPQLRARVRTPDGLADIRFVGIDGPRWMVRAVYQGAAATDETAAALLTEALHGVVVNRGAAAMPVRDPLPLRLPREVAERAAAQQAEEGGGEGGADESEPRPAPAPAGRGTTGTTGRRRPSPRPRPRRG
jgi:hypothetical protein